MLAPNSNIQLIVTDTPFAVAALFEEDPNGLIDSKPFSNDDLEFFKIPLEERIEPYAVAVAQSENELLDVINQAIAKLTDDEKVIEGILKAAAEAKFPKLGPERRAQLHTWSCPPSLPRSAAN